MWRRKDHRIRVLAERTNKNLCAPRGLHHQCHLCGAHRLVILILMDRKLGSLTAIWDRHLQVRARHARAVCGFAARETA